MIPNSPKNLRIHLDDGADVGALWLRPEGASACFVFAHGAGAGMDHGFLASVSEGLAERGVASLRFQFPYMERGSRRTDVPAVAQAAVRAAVTQARHLAPDLPIFAGGKSFGARMTSQAQAASALAGVRGLVFVGFPLHPAGKPAIDRARHLADVALPMLFLQGTRDTLADRDLVAEVVAQIGTRATLEWLEHADHAFQVLVRSGSTNAAVQTRLSDAMAAWMAQRI